MSSTLHPSIGKSSEDPIVASFNAVHAISHLLDETDLSVFYQNKALYSVCEKTLKIEQPSLADANRLIAQAVAS